MSDNTYSGWANRETWAVNLWLSNDEGTNDMCEEIAQDCYAETDEDDSADERKREAGIAAGDRIEAMVDEWAGEFIGSRNDMFTDLLNTALAAVDYREIGATYVEAVTE